MPTNPYFEHTSATVEQSLHHDLAKEIIQLSGVDCHYIKVEQVESDDFSEIFGENRFQKFLSQNTTVIEMYMDNFEQPFEGGNMFSKFGFQTTDTITLVVAKKRAEELLGEVPRVGDYVYLPIFSDGKRPNKLLRITYIDTQKQQFQTLGDPLFYHLSCEVTTFSHEDYNTGTPLDVESLTNETNVSTDNDPLSQNTDFETLEDVFLNFDEDNPFGTP